MVGSKAFDFYALSWGILRKPACNLVETAQRKSQVFNSREAEAVVHLTEGDRCSHSNTA